MNCSFYFCSFNLPLKKNKNTLPKELFHSKCSVFFVQNFRTINFIMN